MINLTPVGEVLSPLKDMAECPPQGKEGAPAARIRIYEDYRGGMKGICPGSKLVILTFFHRSDRKTLEVHPRGNPEKPLTGVFFTRSPARPNPIGLHEVIVEEVDQGTGELLVFPLEALDGTPVVDIKVSIPRATD